MHAHLPSLLYIPGTSLEQQPPEKWLLRDDAQKLLGKCRWKKTAEESGLLGS